ncbi:hypothetical protein RRSWK_03850 [Rhodopirellula sp. SWK7]|nr:hypothetical protein RRSWK_03850 [Rhodopirellula sp. SWK7]
MIRWPTPVPKFLFYAPSGFIERPDETLRGADNESFSTGLAKY